MWIKNILPSYTVYIPIYPIYVDKGYITIVYTVNSKYQHILALAQKIIVSLPTEHYTKQRLTIFHT